MAGYYIFCCTKHDDLLRNTVADIFYVITSATPTETYRMTGLSAVNISGCAKCGTTKAGKRSCCARGGTWFENCGQAGDTQFDHTWTDGIETCKSRLERLAFVTHILVCIVSSILIALLTSIHGILIFIRN